MLTKEVIDYLEQCKKLGLNNDAVIAQLSQKGWDASKLAEVTEWYLPKTNITTPIIFPSTSVPVSTPQASSGSFVTINSGNSVSVHPRGNAFLILFILAPILF